jgi:hypothetical protein
LRDVFSGLLAARCARLAPIELAGDERLRFTFTGRTQLGSATVPGCGSLKALIMSGYGINSEMETQEALARAGMGSDIVHSYIG